MQNEHSSLLSDNGAETSLRQSGKENGQRVGYYYIITKSLKKAEK
ncbi:hypothetical protein [Chitinophaga pinensis]|nr:hypothetical protein [Chitinophaga pinensis]